MNRPAWASSFSRSEMMFCGTSVTIWVNLPDFVMPWKMSLEGD